MGLVGREQGIYCDVGTTPTRTSPLYWTKCANTINLFVYDDDDDDDDAAAAADDDDDDDDDGDDELK